MLSIKTKQGELIFMNGHEYVIFGGKHQWGYRCDDHNRVDGEFKTRRDALQAAVLYEEMKERENTPGFHFKPQEVPTDTYSKREFIGHLCWFIPLACAFFLLLKEIKYA